MTSEERHAILCILAYNYNEICKEHQVATNNARNWRKAEEALALDQRINGEDFLLVMLKKA